MEIVPGILLGKTTINKKIPKAKRKKDKRTNNDLL
jgi:hypothetical protein